MMKEHMFDIYIENFYWNGEYIDDEVRLIQTLPTSDPSSIWITNPSFKAEMGKAEGFDFSVNPGSPYYNSFVQYKTLIRIVYDGTIICYARVTTINTSGLLQVRAIHCEGIYSVLKDSQIEGKEEELQSKTTASALINRIITEHNGRIAPDTWKTVVRGETDAGLDTGESKKMAPTSWGDSLSAIDSILGKYGGYMRVRYGFDPVLNPNNDRAGAIKKYLDWKKDYFRDLGDGNRPHIQVSKNLIDFSSSSEVSELFTRVIPIGQKTGTVKKKESRFIYLSNQYYSVTQICQDYNEADLNAGFHRYSDYANAEANYGVIYKTLNFSNADTAAKLLSYTKDWVKKNYYGALRTFSVKAIDMHMIGENDPKILVGDCVDFTYPEYNSDGQTVLITRKLVCKAVNYNLFNPDQSSYTLGIPSDLLDFEYGEKKKTKKSSSTTSNAAKPSSSGGSPPKVVTWKSVADFLLYYYKEKGWGSYTNSIAGHAYTWRVNNLTDFDHPDTLPYNTFVANKEFKSQHTEEVVTPISPDIPIEEDNYVDVTIVDDYYYATFQGLEKQAHILGHYRISKCDPLFKPNHPELKKMDPEDREALLEKIPTYERHGYEYGVAYVEGTADIFAFSWNEYWRNRNNENAVIPIKFYFVGYQGSTHTDIDVSAPAADTDQDDDPGGDPILQDPGTGAITFTDEHGEPNAEIFPNLGTYKFSDAYDPEWWEDSEGNLVRPNTEGAHPRPLYDDDGNRIWTMAINEPITMLNPDFDPSQPISASNQKYITLGGDGYITTKDLALPGIPSFQTEVAVVHDLIAQRATIGELRAYTAIIGSGEPTPITDTQGNITGYTVDGTQFETNANAMNAVAGVFETDTEGHLITDEEGNAVIKEGGGLSVRKNGVALGYYNSGNLTGGLMVKKINSQTQTTIRGDVINLETGVDAEGNATGQIKLTDAMSISASGGSTVLTFKKLAFFDADVSLTSGTSGSGLLKAPYVATRSRMLFPDSEEYNGNSTVSSATYLDHDRAYELVSGNHPHVKITGPDSNNQYTLWYKPAGLPITSADEDPTVSANGWKNAGNFSRAASGGGPLSGSWSGSSGEQILTVRSGSDGPTYVVAFSGNNQTPSSSKTVLDFNYGSAGAVVSELMGVKFVDVPVDVSYLTGSQSPSVKVHSATVSFNPSNLLVAKTGTNSITSNGPVTLASDKIGFSAVNVNIVPRLNYAFSNDSGIETDGNDDPKKAITISSNPNAQSDIKIAFGNINNADVHLGVSLASPVSNDGGKNMTIPVGVINNTDNGSTKIYEKRIIYNCTQIYNNGWNKGTTAYDPANPTNSGGVEISIGARTTSGTNTLIAGSSLPIVVTAHKTDGSTLDLQNITYTVPDNTSAAQTALRKKIYARFNYNSDEGYFIEPYEGSTDHSAGLSAGKMEYEIGVSGNTVRLQHVNDHSYISGTPTYTIPSGGSAITPTFVWPSEVTGSNTSYTNIEIKSKTDDNHVATAYLSMDYRTYTNSSGNTRPCINIYNTGDCTGERIGRINAYPKYEFTLNSGVTDSGTMTIRFNSANSNDNYIKMRDISVSLTEDDDNVYFKTGSTIQLTHTKTKNVESHSNSEDFYCTVTQNAGGSKELRLSKTYSSNQNVPTFYTNKNGKNVTMYR